MSRLTVAPLAEFDRSGGRVKITAPFGDGRGHQGVDWGTTDGIEVGTTLYAPVDGHIENTGDDGPYTPSGGHTAGRWLWFVGTNGTRWKMFHLNKVTMGTGHHVAAGHPIAEVGNTGTQAAHLHLEEHSGGWGNPVDFTADAHEVINAGRWPGSTPPPTDWFDMATQEELRKIVADEIGKSIKKWATNKRVTQVGSGLFEPVVLGDGKRALRYLRSPAEVEALLALDELSEAGTCNVNNMPGELQEAVKLWPKVADD